MSASHVVTLLKIANDDLPGIIDTTSSN